MYKFCIFAGTTEGRELVDYLKGQNAAVTACVATEYGETLLTPAENLTVSARRLTQPEMVEMFQREQFDLVLDATHPYAQIVTENIRAACAEAAVPYLRVLREASAAGDGNIYVPDIAGAVDYLNTTEGTILLTTGSKELGAYAGLQDFAARVYARVLPMDASLAACQAVGLKPAHIIAMQGPFSEEMNTAMLRTIGAGYLVTKDGGSTGGFAEKASAARKLGVKLVIIGRPPQAEGVSLPEALKLLSERYGCTRVPKVTVVGIGPGSMDAMTHQVSRAIREADCVIGAKRMLEAACAPGQARFDAIAPDKIAEIIHNHIEYRSFTVVMSGDTGFYSGTKKLLPLLAGCDTRVLPGLSSLSYLCARLGTSYEDVKPVSMHGREHDIVSDVRANARVFTLVGGRDGIHELCRSLCDAGLGQVRISVGQKLSYPDEKIVVGTAESLISEHFDTLSAALIENDAPDTVITHGLPDELFLRGAGKDGVVPMTKQEVRAVSLSKLQLTRDAVCWDIGAGTGSVSIEMAMQASGGQVYAVEYKTDAITLLEHNRKTFHLSNLTVVPGKAPEVCAELPAPTHVFIGGSSGKVRDILELAVQKNPCVRIVATAIALETVSELTQCMKDRGFAETEVVCLQASRGKKAGPYHLMTANNPVYIFTLQAGGSNT